MNNWVAILFILVIAMGSFMIWFSLQYTCTTEFTAHGHPIQVCVNDLDYEELNEKGYRHR
tara:strand:- start:487 stop:666 length:180 start_codon:yes stop_codon:yes gene_type:complete